VEITDKARMVQNLVQLTQVVAQVPGAVSYGNDASITTRSRSFRERKWF
jgi:hypothetical protein